MEDYETMFEDSGDMLSQDDFYDILFEGDCDMNLHFANEEMEFSLEEAAKSAQKFLFAVDLVHYVASEFHDLICSKTAIKDSEIISSLFTETVKQAVQVIRLQINDIKCQSMKITNYLCISLKRAEKQCKSVKYFYESFVNSVLGHYSGKSLKAGTFLYLCVYFSELASKCYSSYSEGILDLAVYAILDAFCMFKGKACELNDFAIAVVNNSGYICLLPPSLCIETKVLNKKDQNHKNASFSKYSCEQKNKLKEDEPGLEQPISTTKSDKHEDLNNFELCKGKIGNSQEIEKNRVADKSNTHKSEVISNLSFFMNKSADKKGNDDDYDNALKNLKLEDKLEKDKIISTIKLDENENIENNEENENEEYKSALRQLKNKPYLDNLEYVINKMVNSFPQNELLQRCRVILKQMKLKDESNTGHFEFATDEFVKYIDQNELEECRNVLERFKLADIYDNSDAINMLEYSILKSTKLAEFLGFILKGTISSFFHEKYLIPEIPEESEKINFPVLTTVCEDFLHDVISVVCYEASALFEAHLAQNSTGIKTELELKNKTDFGDNLDRGQDNFIEGKTKPFAEESLASTSVFMQQKKECLCYTFEYKDINFPTSKSKCMDFSGERLMPQKSEESDINLNTHNSENLTEVGITENSGSVFYYDLKSPDSQCESIEICTAYKREDTNDDNVQYLKIDAFLFALDLIRYVAKKFYGIAYNEPTFDEFRSFSCNAFDDSVKNAALFIHNESKTINKTVFDSMEKIKSYYTDYYRKYTDAVLSCYTDGLSSDAFLYYSLHFAELASKLYLADQPRCLELALFSILDAFCLLKDDWKKFNASLQKVLNFYKTRTSKQSQSYYVLFNFRCVKTTLDTITLLNRKVSESSSTVA